MDHPNSASTTNKPHLFSLLCFKKTCFYFKMYTYTRVRLLDRSAEEEWRTTGDREREDGRKGRRARWIDGIFRVFLSSPLFFPHLDPFFMFVSSVFLCL